MAAAEDPEADLITVGKPVDDGKAVWDQHPQHPENYEQAAGEVFISDMRPYKVYRSAGIQQKLGEKPPALRELRDQDASQRLEKYNEAAKARQEARRARREADEEDAPPEGALYITPDAPAPPPQEAPEGEAEAAAEMEEERRTSGQVRRPAGRTQAQPQPTTQAPPPSSPGTPNR